MNRGNVGLFVGLPAGFSDLPDKGRLYGISSLSAICRECRVLSGEESRGEIKNLFFAPSKPARDAKRKK